MIIPRFAKYLSPATISDEYTAEAEVFNNVAILKLKYIIHLDIFIWRSVTDRHTPQINYYILQSILILGTHRFIHFNKIPKF